MKNDDFICYECKNIIPDEYIKYQSNNISTSIFSTWDSLRNKPADFCSIQCMKTWAIRRIIGFSISIIVGLILGISMIINGEGELAIIFTFLPYMIRYAFSRLAHIFDAGVLGEFLTIMVIVISSVTIIYPLYKMVQEIRKYISILKMN